MKKTLVLLVVGLSPKLIGKHTPHLAKLAARGAQRPMDIITPALTCSSQATLVTGTMPSQHGIVANGWYFPEHAEILLWRQPNQLVHGEKIWDAAKKRNPDFTCAKMFWWYNMYSTADYSATPRPMYPADGRKLPDHYTFPPELHDELDAKLGTFPLFTFWGPMANISSTEWIAKSTLHMMETRDPTLTLSYLPHLDYGLQRYGPDLTHPTIQKDLEDVDALCGELIEAADKSGRRIIVVSEYGITPVDDAVHINRALREAGLIRVRPEEDGREILDCGASDAFAMADHQIAHIYVNNKDRLEEVRQLVAALDGVESVWGEDGKRANGLDHERSGDLIAISTANRWFSYYYWLDEDKAPDFAPTVDIHRKPGYDPVELFFDPKFKFPKLAAGLRLAKRKLGFRGLLDVISPSATHLVGGSHGRLTDDPDDGPVVISSEAELMPEGPTFNGVGFKDFTLDHIFK